MPRATSWRDLKLGLAALAVTAGAVALVLGYARVGALHGDAFRLHAATPHARGLLPGSEVWLSGQRVGTVRGVEYRAPSTDTTARLLISMDVLERHRALLRRDARVDVRAGGSFIGSPVVWIEGGTPAAEVLADGDTLVANPSRELQAMRADLALATAEVPHIVANLRVLATQLRAAGGTLGAFTMQGSADIDSARAAAGRVLARAQRGPGTLGLTFSRRVPIAHARHALALADSVRALLASSSTSLGRLRRDSSLVRTVDALRADLAAVQAALIEPRGTAGRARHDAALARQLATTRAEVDALSADLRRNPLRYLVF